MKYLKAISIFILFNLIIGCVSVKEAQITRIDELINAAAEETIKILPKDESRTLAIYYFTVEGEKSAISDYMINGLTTEIANLISVNELNVNIVSRQNFESIMDELSFQMSDLVNEENQLRIGRQIGADIILIGLITPVTEMYKLNCQLITIETGVVLGGFKLDFTLESDFEEKMAADDEGKSRIIIIEDKVTQTGANATETSIYETFDTGMAGIQLSHYEESWGEQVISTSGKISIENEDSFNESPYAKCTFNSEIKSVPPSFEWDDSELIFYFTMKGLWETGDFDGLALSIKPVGFNQLGILLLQQHGDENVIFDCPLTLNEGEWQDLKIPFYNFYGYDGYDYKFDKNKSVTVQIVVPFMENINSHYFRTGTEISGDILVDNIGFFKIIGEDDISILECFNDNINRMTFTTEVYNSSYYTDYSLIEGMSDEDAEKINIMFKTPGVTSQSIKIQKLEGNISGDYLNISYLLDVNEELEKFIKTDDTFSLFLKFQAGKSWKDFNSLNFYMKSDIFESGYIEYQDCNNELYFSYDMILGEIWSRIQIPLIDEISKWTDNPYLIMSFCIPPEKLKQSIQKGKLEFNISMDEFILEK